MAPKKSTEQTTTQTSTVPASSPVSTPVVSEKPKKVKKTETSTVQSAPVVSETPVSQSEKPKKTSKKPQSTETPAVQLESVVESSTQSVSEKPKKASKKKSQTTETPVEQTEQPTEQQSEQPVEKKKRASKKNVVSEGESAESDSVETQSTETSESAEKRVRKVVNQDTLRSDVEQLKTHVDEEIQRLRTSEQKNKGVKFLKVVNKSLKTLLADLNRVLKTKTKATRSKNTSSGFMKPVKISSEMALFTKWDPSQLYSRVDVTKFLCNYIKVNQLQNPEDRRQILCDDSLSSLLKVDKSSQNPLTYPGLQQHIQQHFITDVTSVSEEEAHP
jgi:chromatin remodeling complex protein RSC6